MIESIGTYSYVEGIMDAVSDGLPYGRFLKGRPADRWDVTSFVALGLAAAGGIGLMSVASQGVNVLTSPGWFLLLAPSVAYVLARRQK